MPLGGSAQVQSHLRPEARLDILPGILIFKAKDPLLEIRAQEVWHPDHGSLVVSPQSSYVFSQHLCCDFPFEVTDSGVVFGRGLFDRLEVDLTFCVLLQVLHLDLAHLPHHLTIILMDEGADYVIVGEESA